LRRWYCRFSRLYHMHHLVLLSETSASRAPP
jgi:hypothetical protein